MCLLPPAQNGLAWTLGFKSLYPREEPLLPSADYRQIEEYADSLYEDLQHQLHPQNRDSAPFAQGFLRASLVQVLTEILLEAATMGGRYMG